jgi:leucyl-tRNA synthetase
VIQVDGKVRDRIEVPVSTGQEALRDLALGSEKVQQALHGAQVARVIVKPPNLVNVVSRE